MDIDVGSNKAVRQDAAKKHVFRTCHAKPMFTSKLSWHAWAGMTGVEHYGMAL